MDGQSAPMLPGDAPSPRLCHLIKWPDFDGYGFNLHAEKEKTGQFIGKVDDDSPAMLAGLREGDRIVEVNFVNICNENHRQVVERIKSIPNETRLLVVDNDTDRWYKSRKLVIKSSQHNVIYYRSPVPRPLELGQQPVPASPDMALRNRMNLPPQSPSALSNSNFNSVATTNLSRQSSAVMNSGNSASNSSSLNMDSRELNSSGNVNGNAREDESGRKTDVTSNGVSDRSHNHHETTTAIINHHHHHQHHELSASSSVEQILPEQSHKDEPEATGGVHHDQTDNDKQDSQHYHHQHRNEHHQNDHQHQPSPGSSPSTRHQKHENGHQNSVHHQNTVEESLQNLSIHKNQSPVSRNQHSSIESQSPKSTHSSLSEARSLTSNGSHHSLNGGSSNGSRPPSRPISTGDPQFDASLNMTASEMRQLLASRKKKDAKKANLDLREKYDLIQQL